MNAIIQGLNANVGLVSFILMLFVAYMASRSMAKTKVNDQATKAQGQAIEAMKEEIESLRRKVDDAKQENIRLRRVIETIRIALERRGLTIIISDDAIEIEDKNKSTIIRIQNEDIP